MLGGTQALMEHLTSKQRVHFTEEVCGIFACKNRNGRAAHNNSFAPGKFWTGLKISSMFEP